jgi:surfactin synthase thioesterase subunit
LELFPGSHFFPQTTRESVLRSIASSLSPSLA